MMYITFVLQPLLFSLNLFRFALLGRCLYDCCSYYLFCYVYSDGYDYS